VEIILQQKFEFHYNRIGFNCLILQMAQAELMSDIDGWLEEGRCVSFTWVSRAVGISAATASRFELNYSIRSSAR
jgi:hypothetical protein